ncbi:MAG: hypothetical protein RIC35_24850 [Marinoscillum sp.]
MKIVNEFSNYHTSYAFETGITRNGVFLSDDRQCTAICYRYNFKKDGFKDYWNQLLLVLNCIGISNLSSVLKREAYINKLRPKDGQFLYFWFFGATQRGIKMRSVYELKKHIFDLSKNLNLPIYLETSVPKNQKIYQRFGFEIYHTWGQREQTTLWFMKREPR